MEPNYYASTLFVTYHRMLGEPKFDRWNTEPPLTATESAGPLKSEESANQEESVEPENIAQNAEQKNVFDASRIQFLEGYEEPWREHDQALCERLNQGERFALVFTNHVFDVKGMPGWLDLLRADTESENWSLYETEFDHLFHAAIVLADGQHIAFPYFEQAAGLHFGQSMFEDHRQGGNRTTKNEDESLTVEVTEVKKWIKERFGNQFIGVVEANPQFGDEPNEAENKAISQAAQLLREGSLNPDTQR